MSALPTPTTPPTRTAQAKPTLRLMARDDQEFLPAAIEILERPGSPIAFALISAITAFAAIAVLWAWLGWTDVIAIAHGKIQPTGRVKTVQPLEIGRVKSILAVNGNDVKAGDPLILLDPQDAIADQKSTEAALRGTKAEIIRRMTAAQSALLLPRDPLEPVWTSDIPADIRKREASVLSADLRSLASQIASLDAQSAQKQAEKARIEETIRAQEALIATMQERVDMRSSLLASSSGTKSNLIDATESLNYQTTILVTERGQAIEAERALESLGAEKEKLLRGFVAENTTKRVDAERQADELEQRLAKANQRVERMTLSSPADGKVQASSVTGIGQVLQPGQEVMRIVPDSGALEIEVYLENKDIGFVRDLQEASVKIDAFPFTRYGTVPAKVVRVATDAIPASDASQIEADPTRPGETRTPAGGQRVQNLVFPIMLTTEVTSIIADGRTVPLSPGMTVTAEIKTGKRRILEYLFSPLVEIASGSLKER